MRARARTIAAVAAAAVIGACGNGREEIDAGVRDRVVALGDSAAMSLARTLSGRLNAALSVGGPAAAIEFCAGRAMELTDSVSDALGPGWSLRRTALRTRNPANAPDSLEALALQWFQAAEDSAAATGAEPPLTHVQRTPAGDYRYYMPVRMGHMCLECHGDREQIEPAVRAVLDQRYPADQATGYGQGELRGLIRVTVPASAIDN